MGTVLPQTPSCLHILQMSTTVDTDDDLDDSWPLSIAYNSQALHQLPLKRKANEQASNNQMLKQDNVLTQYPQSKTKQSNCILSCRVWRHIVNYRTKPNIQVLTLVFTLRSVPASNKSLIHSLFPFLQARYRGVCPPSAAWLILASYAINNSTHLNARLWLIIYKLGLISEVPPDQDIK